MCSTFNVKCSWDVLLWEINSFCVWTLWCSELCSIDQTVTVRRRSVLDVRGPEWFFKPFCSLYISTVFGEWGGLLKMIRSAVRTTLRSLLRSDLVAELNQTVIDVQRTDSMMAEYCFSSSCGKLNFLSWWMKYSLCWAFLTTESMWLSHFRSWEMVVPRNLNDSTAVTVLFMMVSGGEQGGFLLKSTIISTVLSVLRSRLLRLHQTASSLTSCL